MNAFEFGVWGARKRSEALPRWISWFVLRSQISAVLGDQIIQSGDKAPHSIIQNSRLQPMGVPQERTSKSLWSSRPVEGRWALR